MNKVIACLIVAVCLLGMALIILNQQLEPKPAPVLQGQSHGTDTKLPALPETLGAPGQGEVAPREAANSGTKLPPLPDSLEIAHPNVAIDPLPPAERSDRAEAPAAKDASPKSRQPEPTSVLSQTRQSGSSPAAVSVQEPSAPQVKESAGSQVRDIRRPVHAATETAEKPAAKPETRQRTAELPGAGRPMRAQTNEKPRNEDKKRQDSSRNGQIRVFTRQGGATVRLTGSQALSYKQTVLKNPDRVVLDITGNWDVRTDAIPGNVLVSGVRIGRFTNRTRVVIDLKGAPAKTKLVPSGDRRRVDIRVDK